MKKTNCYMTFADEQYLPCVIRQAQRIKYLNSKYEYIVMVDENDLVSQQKLKENNIHCILIKQELFSQISSGRFQKTFNKFKIIDYLDKYEKICWLDADTILAKNIDYLFDEMSIDCQFLGFFNILINKIEGIIFICSDKINLNNFKQFLNKSQDNRIDDEEVLNDYFLQQKNIILFEKLPLIIHHFGGFMKLFNTFNSFPLIYKLFFTMSDIEFNIFVDKYSTQLNDMTIQWIDLVNALEKSKI